MNSQIPQWVVVLDSSPDASEPVVPF